MDEKSVDKESRYKTVDMNDFSTMGEIMGVKYLIQDSIKVKLFQGDLKLRSYEQETVNKLRYWMSY